MCILGRWRLWCARLALGVAFSLVIAVALVTWRGAQRGTAVDCQPILSLDARHISAGVGWAEIEANRVVAMPRTTGGVAFGGIRIAQGNQDKFFWPTRFANGAERALPRWSVSASLAESGRIATIAALRWSEKAVGWPCLCLSQSEWSYPGNKIVVKDSITAIGFSFPRRVLWKGMCVNALFWAGVGTALSRVYRVVVMRVRAGRGECVQCGYNLLSEFSGGCPECGWRRIDKTEWPTSGTPSSGKSTPCL